MIELAEIEAARARIAGSVVRTPLVRLHVEDAPAEIYLKLENLQPINSFKIRGATNAVMLAPASARAGAWSRPARGTWPRASHGRPASSASRPRSSYPTTRRRPSSPRSSGWAAGC